MNTFGVDENGIILTEVSRDYITLQFKPAVEDILKIIIQEFALELDGIFLYGSVVTGKAVAEKSDLDTILIFKNKVSTELKGRVLTLKIDYLKNTKLC